MKTLSKFFLIAFCLLTTCLANAQGTRFTRYDGAYFSAGATGPLTGAEATIEGYYIEGTAFIRGTSDDYITFATSGVTAAGTISGRFYGSDRGTFTGRVTGSVVILTFNGSRGRATVVLVKTSGYAPAFIAGKYVEFSYLNPAVGDSRIYYELDFDGPNYVYVYRYYNGSTGSLVRYTYRKTGANTATVNIPGLGTLQLRYTSTYGGTIVGPGINTTFDQDDLASD